MTGDLGKKRDDDRVLAGEYALGLLLPDAAAAFEARLVHEPDLRATYAAWAEDFVQITDDIAPVAPPASALRGIEARLFATQTPAPRGLLERLGLGQLFAGLVAVAVLVFALVSTGVLDRGPQAPAHPSHVAQIAAQDRSLIVAAAYDAENGALFVERTSGAPRPGRALELWLIAGGNAPVSLGVLPEGARGSIDIPTALRAQLAGGVLAVSDEPPGGSPTGAPTGDVLAVGEISAV